MPPIEDERDNDGGEEKRDKRERGPATDVGDARPALDVGDARAARAEARNVARLERMVAEQADHLEILADRLQQEREERRAAELDWLREKDALRERHFELLRQLSERRHVSSRSTSRSRADEVSIAEETESSSEDEDHVGVKKHHVEDSNKKRSCRKQAKTTKKEQGTSEQAEFMAAIRSMAMPKLPPYSGKDDPEGERLEQLVKEFERHSSIAGWKGQLKIQQFALRLTGRALSAYESMSEADRESFPKMLEVFKAKALPLMLESYRSRMFHSRLQENESVQQYAQELQHLFEKAYGRFAVTKGLKDHLLLGQFEQGLWEKWKRELKPPPRTFEEALTLAHTAEAAEKQLLRRSREKGHEGVT